MIAVGAVSLLLAALGVVGAFWWWALLGLSSEVGTAVGVTLAVVATFGMVCLIGDS